MCVCVNRSCSFFFFLCWYFHVWCFLLRLLKREWFFCCFVGVGDGCCFSRKKSILKRKRAHSHFPSHSELFFTPFSLSTTDVWFSFFSQFHLRLWLFYRHCYMVNKPQFNVYYNVEIMLCICICQNRVLFKSSKDMYIQKKSACCE